jgi:hypothetical protein
MNTLTTGTHTPPNDPRFDRPFELEGESGILEATIFCEGAIVEEYEDKRYLGYVTRKTVNGVELEIEYPQVRNANAVEEDIKNSLMQQGIKFDTISFITK